MHQASDDAPGFPVGLALGLQLLVQDADCLVFRREYECAGLTVPETAARAEALARRIREHREAFACSQQEFARESGISRATLSKHE